MISLLAPNFRAGLLSRLGRRSAIYVHDNQEVELPDHSIQHTPNLTASSIYQGGMPLKRFGPFFSNVSVESHDATTRCTCGASDAESDRSSTFCSREPCEDIPSEPEFIRSIGASFAIPYSHGELDWLKGLNAELYENPLSSLLEESGEFLPKDHNHVSSQVFESFLDFEDDDEGVELTTEDSSSLTQTSFSQDSSCTDRSSYYPSKQIIHVILPQFSQCDTWKKQMPPPFVFPRRRRFLSSSKFSKFVGRLWRKS